jgi:NADH-quinone oxidoreductase subunit L
METLHLMLLLVPACPLAAALVTAVCGPRLLGQRSHWPVVLGLAAASACSLALLWQVGEQAEVAALDGGPGFETTVDLWRWVGIEEALPTPAAALPAAAGGPAAALPPRLPLLLEVTLRADALTAIMLAMVTCISTLVAIYAGGYMRGDRGFWRFFSYLGLFVFSMTMLVSVSNFVLLYVFWEAVGVCSYLLIGFWYEKPAAAAAGKKAFLVNRVGDFGFALAVFLLWTTYGTLNFHDSGSVAGVLGQTRLTAPQAYVGGGTAVCICLLLMLGACGKSAQFPLHVWLPDAMEGPTPVSALIHAATMVTAGVYMVTRCTPLFVAAPQAQQVVALVGAGTAAMAGFIALTQTDLKRVLAYSTVSQLGYMFLGLGCGTLAGITAGMFHLFTHAFFKALLFLGAGSVMHAMGGVIDVGRFGGLRRLLPVTHGTFLVGCLALAGVFPLAGFFSKDAILAAVHDQAHDGRLFQVLFWLAVATAGLTALYTFRAYFLTFFGPQRVPEEAGHHAHESPASMTGPLVILAACAAAVGVYCQATGGFAELLGQTPQLAVVRSSAAHGGSHALVAALSTAVALAGIATAAYLYLGSRAQAQWLATVFRPLHWLSRRKLLLDELYLALVVWPLRLLALVCAAVDRYVIDGLVDLCGRLPAAAGAVVRSVQSGMTQFYALAMVLGLLALVGALLVWPG